MNDAHRNRYTTECNTQKIKECSKKYCFFGRKRICIDHWCYRIRGIMETIDKFKCTNQE